MFLSLQVVGQNSKLADQYYLEGEYQKAGDLYLKLHEPAKKNNNYIYFNKYIDGQPFLCEALELSTTGMLVRTIHEPEAPRACYAVEIAANDGEAEERLWLCATPVWRDGPIEALGFVGQSERDKQRLEKMILGGRAVS